MPNLFGFAQHAGTGPAWWAERRPRRPGEDERRQGRMRTSYAGDDVFLSLSWAARRGRDAALRRLGAARALHQPRPADPRRPAGADARERRPGRGGDAAGALRTAAPVARRRAAAGGESRADELPWRLVLSSRSTISASRSRAAPLEPLRATLELYADRGDPALARHARALADVRPPGGRAAADRRAECASDAAPR